MGNSMLDDEASVSISVGALRRVVLITVEKTYQLADEMTIEEIKQIALHAVEECLKPIQ